MLRLFEHRAAGADFDDLVTLVTLAPPWEKDRAAGVRIMLRAIAEGKPDAPEQILARWTWRLAKAVRKTLDRKASQEYPDAKRLLGALANSRGNRHEENTARLVKAALEMPRDVGAALLATAEGYTETSLFKIPNSSNQSWAHPVVIGGKLYLREKDVLWCYDVSAK